MNRAIAGIMVGTLLVISLPVLAEDRMDRERHFEGHDIHRFSEHDLGIWRKGHWVHGRHEGRRGWHNHRRQRRIKPHVSSEAGKCREELNCNQNTIGNNFPLPSSFNVPISSRQNGTIKLCDSYLNLLRRQLRAQSMEFLDQATKIICSQHPIQSNQLVGIQMVITMGAGVLGE